MQSYNSGKKINVTLSVSDSPFFSQMYVKDDGVVFLIKLNNPFIDVSHMSLFPSLTRKLWDQEI